MEGTEFFGHKVKDKITGFTGIATGFVQYISGCNQILICPGLDKDGKLAESHWFDEQRLLVFPCEDQITLDNGNTPGFDMEAPKR